MVTKKTPKKATQKTQAKRTGPAKQKTAATPKAKTRSTMPRPANADATAVAAVAALGPSPDVVAPDEVAPALRQETEALKSPVGPTERWPPSADPRMPEPGTTLRKRDRHGSVRCECTVDPCGVWYKDVLYRSLSAAALAAAKDLDLNGKTQNGFTFWGLSKPPRRNVDPIAALESAWQRYLSRLQESIERVGHSPDGHEGVCNLVQQHIDAMARACDGESGDC